MSEVDTWALFARYRNVRTLPGAERLLLRPPRPSRMSRGRWIRWLGRLRRISYFCDDAADPDGARSSVQDLDLRKVYPLIVVVDDLIAGYAELHLREQVLFHMS